MLTIEDIKIQVVSPKVISIRDILPSGSGFNYKWYLENVVINNRVYCELASSYQVMNENGDYCGTIDFVLRVPLWNGKEWADNFEVIEWSDNVDEDEDIDDLHDYIEDCIASAFGDIHTIYQVISEND